MNNNVELKYKDFIRFLKEEKILKIFLSKFYNKENIAYRKGLSNTPLMNIPIFESPKIFFKDWFYDVCAENTKRRQYVYFIYSGFNKTATMKEFMVMLNKIEQYSYDRLTHSQL